MLCPDDEKRMDLPFMAPWIEYKNRPIRNQGEDMMIEDPKELQEYVKENISNDGK